MKSYIFATLILTFALASGLVQAGAKSHHDSDDQPKQTRDWK